jgi:molecular chaperone GrpE
MTGARKNDDSAEDVDYTSEEEMGTAGALKAKLAKLRDELETTKKERAEYLDGWQRCKADTANAKRDAATALARAEQRARESLTDDLLPVLDGFDMAMGGETWESVGEEWRRGIEYIRNQLLDVLSRHGIERYGKIGDAFDHAIHEAVQETDDTPGESGSVVRILRHGYRSAERIIRPAQVIVKK